jgi:hypothetical protein
MMVIRRETRQARYERACWWLEHGVDVVPLKPQSKELQPGYGTRKAHITDSDFASRWFLNTDANLGVVLGGPTGLAVADWDAVPAYADWCARVGAPELTLVERTARGYHWFFRSAGIASAVDPGCEIKTRGVCMVSPSVHPTGQVYHLLQEAPIVILTAARAATLFPFLSTRLPGAPPMPSRTKPVAMGVIARIKAVRPIVAELQAAGITLQPAGQATWVGRCPFHDDQTPSLWANPASGLWGCNRPDCRAAGVHDVINFRALWRGVSNQEAIQQLAAEFLAPSPQASLRATRLPDVPPTPEADERVVA